MKVEKLRGTQRADVLLNETQWTVAEWEEFCKKTNSGLIIENGHITGFVTNPVEYRI